MDNIQEDGQHMVNGRWIQSLLRKGWGIAFALFFKWMKGGVIIRDPQI